MIEILFILALCAVDAILIIGFVFLGWRPLHRVLGRVWAHAWRALAVFVVTALGLTILIPWIDVGLYTHGVVLDDDFMIFFAPALILITSLAMSIAVVWARERRATT